MNGDLVVESDLRELIRSHRAQGSVVTIGVRSCGNAAKLGAGAGARADLDSLRRGARQSDGSIQEGASSMRRRSVI